jgi:hypothetical protein
MEEMRNAYKILVESLKVRDHLEDLGLYGKIILKWLIRKQGGRVWTGIIWFRIDTVGRLL